MAEFDGLRRSLLLALGASGLEGGAVAWAQRSAARTSDNRWPAQDVELTVPFPVGGSSSLLGRTLSRQFTVQTGRALRLEYRGGAAGTAGAVYVAKSPADGQHLLMGGTNMVVARAVQLQLDVDLYEDFVPLALVAEMPQVLVVNARKLNMRTWTEMLAELRRRPPRYRYASAGIGSTTHIVGEWLKYETGALIEHVPYKGSGPALLDVVNGNVDMMLDGLASALPHLQADRLRPMFVTSAERSPLLPAVPTARELGLLDFQLHAWYGVFAPQATPAAIQAQVIDVFRTMSSAPAVQKAWSSMGARWPGLYGNEFARFVQDEMQRWAAIVRNTTAVMAGSQK